MHTQRRYATCPQDMSKKGEKKEEEKYMYIYIAHDQEKNTKREREIDHPMEFIRYPPKIFHTLAPLDQVV